MHAQDAKTRHALLYPHKAVVVNNEPITHTTLLFTADKIGTGPDGAAAIISAQSVVTLAGNSLAVYGPNFLKLQEGTATISTGRGFSAAICELSVAPANANADFVVSLQADSAVIVVNKGSVISEDESGRDILHAGERQVRPLRRCGGRK